MIKATYLHHPVEIVSTYETSEGMMACCEYLDDERTLIASSEGGWFESTNVHIPRALLHDITCVPDADEADQDRHEWAMETEAMRAGF